MKYRLLTGLALLSLLAAGCSRFATPSPPSPTARAAALTVSPLAMPSPAFSVTLFPSATHTSAPALTPTHTPTNTPDPYAGLTIADLSVRAYGGGELRVEQFYGQIPEFSRYIISYPSDGLTIYGFMNVPSGDGPFPVVIALHGYIDPAIYQTLDYTTENADSLARAGYLVLHPNLRGFPPSDDGPNLFRVGMAVDVLNLIALVKSQGGQPGPLQQADPQRIGLWGHSMGGGVSIRVLTLSPEIKAAVLYGSMNADDQLNYTRIYYEFSDETRGKEELGTPPQDFARISPVSFLEHIQAAVSIHHGEADALVPPEWSADLCQRLQELGKIMECFVYPGQPHTFRDDGALLFEQRVVDFFNRFLR